MPNYKYQCLECGHKFQALLPAGTQEAACLECGHPAQKLLEAPGVQFMGEGFYKTDSAKKPKPSESSKE